MKRGISSELSVILAVLFAVLAVIALVVVFTRYNPPKPSSQQVGKCAMQGINVENYNRIPKNALDAASMINVSYHGIRVSPCLVNENINPTDTCTLGEEDNILLQVNEKQCNLVDILPR